MALNYDLLFEFNVKLLFDVEFLIAPTVNYFLCFKYNFLCVIHCFIFKK